MEKNKNIRKIEQKALVEGVVKHEGPASSREKSPHSELDTCTGDFSKNDLAEEPAGE